MQNNKVNLDGTIVGENYFPYIIAEIGQNHNGDIHFAKKLIDAAVRSGANAVKFQKRDIKSELTKDAYEQPYISKNSFGKTYGEHRAYLEFSIKQHKDLLEYSKKKGITYFCTPCDEKSVDELETIGCPFYKVASRDLSNHILLNKLSKIDKPIIISTGMSDLIDIERAINILKKDNNNLIIMQCTSEYPCSYENVNLNAINTIKNKFNFLVGFSDHTSGIIISAVSPLFGATVIEKHITLDRSMKGSDHAGSIEESGLKKLIQYIYAINLSKGIPEKFKLEASKEASAKLERSIVTKIKIKKGQLINENMLTLKSPGHGLRWHQRDMIIGKKAIEDIIEDTILNLNQIN